MQKFTKLYYVAIALSATTLFSCSKDDDGGDPDPNDPASQKCKVTGMNYIDGTTERSSTVTYNSAGRVTAINSFSNGAPDGSETVEYNSAGQVIKVTEDDGEYNTFEYNSNGQVIKESYFYDDNPGDPIVLQYYSTYEYNADKKLVKISEYDASAGNQLDGYEVFTYNSANSVTEQWYSLSTGTPTLSYTTEYAFDDKNSYLGSLGVLSGTMGMLSKHNVLTAKQTYFNTTGNPSVSTTTYAYEYNADGYPTKRTSTYNGMPESGVRTFTYNCK